MSSGRATWRVTEPMAKLPCKMRIVVKSAGIGDLAERLALGRQIRRWLLEQGLYQRSGTNLLKIAVDDVFAFRDAFQDRYEAAVAGA